MINILSALLFGGLSSVTMVFSSKNSNLSNRSIVFKTIGAFLWGGILSIIWIIFFGNLQDFISVLKMSIIIGIIIGIFYTASFNYVNK